MEENVNDTLIDEGLENQSDEPVLDALEGTSEESQPTNAEQNEANNYYSPDEFKNLIKKGAVFMDASRVSPEHRAYFEAVLEREKSMQADYTRKTQELAHLRRNLEAQKLSAEERFIHEYFQNPVKVKKDVSDAISLLEEQEVSALEEMDFQKVKEIRTQKAKLQKVLNDAETAYLNMKQGFDYVSMFENAFKTEIIKDFPDFFTGKQEALSQYLASEGVDPRVQAIISNPVLLDTMLKQFGINDIDGITASRQIIKAVNNAFERANAAKTVAQKEVKKPPITGKTGIGEVSPDASIKALKEKAMREGDISSWAEYMFAKEKNKKEV